MYNVIILAAGKGSRLKSDLPKIYHKIFEKEILSHISSLFDRSEYNVVFVINSKYIEDLKRIVGKDVKYVIDDEQIGTGNSVRLATEVLESNDSKTIILNGDCPLFRIESIESALKFSQSTYSDLTLITATPQNTFGYGRVVKNYDEIIKIVEQKDATEEEKSLKEVNTGTYIVNTKKLSSHITSLKNNNVQKEYYLTDIIEIFINNHYRCNTFPLSDETEMYNINDRIQLEQVSNILKNRINEKHMKNGVTIYDSKSTYIGPNVIIEQDVVIYPGNYISGDTVIKKNNIILTNNTIIDSKIGSKNYISNSVISDSTIGDYCEIGPFAHIRNNSNLNGKNRVGNFVEVKNSVLGTETKSAHLSYMGDSEFGKRINIGCGSITVNYDGKNKHKTQVGDDTFIGCNSNLIAPITIGKNNFIAAGSTVNESTKDNSFVIARNRQVTKEDYADKIWKKMGK